MSAVGQKPESVVITNFEVKTFGDQDGWLSKRSVGMYGLGSDGNVYAWSIEFGYWLLATTSNNALFAVSNNKSEPTNDK